VTPGTVLFDPNFKFNDETQGRKLFVLLTDNVPRAARSGTQKAVPRLVVAGTALYVLGRSESAICGENNVVEAAVSRRKHLALLRGRLLEPFSQPDFDNGLSGYAKPRRFFIQRFDHPSREVDVHPLLFLEWTTRF